jgi:hypothetical protein
VAVDDERALPPLAGAEVRTLLQQACGLQNPVSLRLLEPLEVVGLRTLQPDAPEWRDWLEPSGADRLPAPGRWVGEAARVVWCGPREFLLLSEDRRMVDSVLQRLRPGQMPHTLAVDRTAGTLGVEIRRPALREFMVRLVDASALPAGPQGASRGRCMDLAVTLINVESDAMWLLAERAAGVALALWLLEACHTRLAPRSA